MSESIYDQIEDVQEAPVTGARILVIGVGGGGGNAVQYMMERDLAGVEFVCANTDVQALNRNPAATHIQLGEKLTKGLGAGANPDVGRQAANESQQLIEEAVGNAEMVFITAGMGGGTGTGAAPIVAEIARKNGALTVGVVTRPFAFEGKKRAGYADAGIEELSKHVDCLITIPNDRIMTFAPKKTPLRELMRRANDVLYFGVKGISDVITCPGYINLDFADVRTCMQEAGLALMGMGTGSGENRAEEAAHNAITSPLLEDVSLNSARAILYNITAPEDITGEEMELIGEMIREQVPDDANIMAGVVFDDSLQNEIRVTVVATGIERTQPVADVRAPQHATPARLRRGSWEEGSYANAPRATRLSASELEQGARVHAFPAQSQAQLEAAAETGSSAVLADGGFRRWRKLHPDQGERRQHMPGSSDFLFDSDDLDVPTFIRKQAD